MASLWCRTQWGKGRNWRHSALDNRNSMCGRWFGGKGGSELQIVLTRSNVVMRLLNYVNPIQRWGGGGGGGAAFEVPLTKKLNNFKAVQAGTTNLSDFSKNSSGNLKFISWSLCQHWCYHGNRVLASTVFSLKNRLYFYFNRWNYYITLYLALFYQSYCNMSFIWPNDRCWLKFSTVLISLSEFHTLMIFFFFGGGGGFLSILLYSERVSFLL